MQSTYPSPSFPKINLSRYIGSPKPGTEKIILGFDTETLDGEIALICVNDATGTYADSLYPDNALDVLDFMTHHFLRETTNFFFNMQYDVDSLLKMCPEDVQNGIFADGIVKY